MNLRYLTLLGSLSALAVGGALLGPARVAAQDTEGVEELTRGPVHEAFAETISFEAEAGEFVSTAPPAAIEEIPPDSRPDGDNVSWIPGYWAWDDDQNDYLWISGIWRNLPPGREWVPGYWNDSDSKYQWISGYWADSNSEEVTYLPAPPKSIEAGPNIEAPDNNHSWIPGSWVYREERYGWRPGYWEPVQENWIVVPSHYSYTPRGYVYVDSYYDYSVARRGVIFAPVRFRREVYIRPNYYYTPLTVISLNVFSSHLFVRPSRSHYYFGDYYEPRYRDRGFFASFSYSSGRRGYDPFYAHNRWEHRSDRDWDRRRRDDFDYYRDNADARPPRTWAALRERGEDDRRGRRDDFVLAEPLSRRAERRDGKGDDSRQRFVSVSKETREKIVVDRKEVTKFRDERKKSENRDGDRSGPRTQASREKINRSPVVSRKIEDLAKDEAPPIRPKNRDADIQGSAAARGGDKNADGPRNGREPGNKEDNNRSGRAGADPANRDQKDLPEGVGRGQKKEGENLPRNGADANSKGGKERNPSAEPAVRENNPEGDNAPGETPKAKPEGAGGSRSAREGDSEAKGRSQAEPQQRNRQTESEQKPKGKGAEPQAAPRQAQPESQPRNRQAAPDQKPKAKEAGPQSNPRQSQQEQPRKSAPAKEINRPQPQKQQQRQAEPEQRKQTKPQQSPPEARVRPRQQQPERQAAPARQEPQRQARQEPQRQAQSQQSQPRQAQAQPRQAQAQARQATAPREKKKGSGGNEEEGGRNNGR